MKKILLFFILVIMGLSVMGASPVNPPPKWKKVSGGTDGQIGNKPADSIWVETQNSDTIWFTNSGIYWHTSAILDSALLDSVATAKGRFAPDIWGEGTALNDTAVYYFNNDTIVRFRGSNDTTFITSGDNNILNINSEGTSASIVGGSGTTSDLNLKTTTGIGAAGADMHFLVGNNGATEAMTVLNNGNVGVGITAPTSRLSVGNSNNFQVDSVGALHTTGTVNWGDAVSLEIPNGVNPTTDVEGEIAWDSDDDAIEVFDGVNSMLIPAIQTARGTIWSPDGISDTIPILYIDSTTMPNGIKIVSIEVHTSVDGVYAVNFYEFTAADPPVFSAHIDTLNVAALDQRVQSELFTDSDIAVGAFIYINTPATVIDWMRFSIRYYIKDNN